MIRLNKRRGGGFTLLELLLTIAAVGILASIVLVSINPNRQLAQARDNVRQQNINAISKTLEQYLIDNGKYPEEIPSGTYEAICGGNNTVDCINLNSKLAPTYLAEIPKDSTGENYLVGIHPTNNRISVWAVDA
ncbi:MAG: hypothetical protein RLZZ223_23 [Candidatus Parcubacteria bacterium]|jgi:prepilin-type N-terminal cleavage/methylation domain-containing protein